MDYWLLGEPFKKEISGIISAGISIGTIQVPVDGQPIIQKADHKTSSCYTRIANIITANPTLLV
jgi:antagonist of KipI